MRAMGWVGVAALVGAVMLSGCGSAPAAPDSGAEPRDAGGQEDGGGAMDAGGELDAGALVDSGTDAGSPDAGPCDPITSAGCALTEACRHANDGAFPWFGPLECQGLVATLAEGERGCMATDAEGVRRDLCDRGLFCAGQCRRFCDPEADACPDVDGSPRYCWPSSALGFDTPASCWSTPPP